MPARGGSGARGAARVSGMVAGLGLWGGSHCCEGLRVEVGGLGDLLEPFLKLPHLHTRGAVALVCVCCVSLRVRPPQALPCARHPGSMHLRAPSLPMGYKIGRASCRERVSSPV